MKARLLKLGVYVLASGATVFSQTGLPQGGRQPAAQTIDLATAKKMGAAAEQEAIKANAKVGIAVVDSNGDLVFSERIDGASTRGVTSSQGKARAALLFGLPTKKVQDIIASGKPVQASINAVAASSELVLNQGGLPILKDGRVIGAIGVGGSASSEDERFAQAGIDAVFGSKSAE
jgi:glc operon protein GlcG